MALGTFSAIAVLLGELDSDLEPGDDNAITVGLDAATFTQSSLPTPATPRPRPHQSRNLHGQRHHRLALAGTSDDRQAERATMQRRDRQADRRQAGVARDRS